MTRSKKAVVSVYAVTKTARAQKLVVHRMVSVAIASTMATADVEAQVAAQLDVDANKRLVGYDGREGMTMGKIEGKDVFFPAVADVEVGDDDEAGDDADDTDDADDDDDSNAWPFDQAVVGLNHVIEEAKKASMTGSAPDDALLNWKSTSKKLTASFVVLFTAGEVPRAAGTGQGRMSYPYAQTQVKRVFNYHATREPAAGTLLGTTNLKDYYTAAVMGLAQGMDLNFERAQCKPYVRDGKSRLGHSRRLRIIERETRKSALDDLVREHPEILEGLEHGRQTLDNLWQKHKDQIGREFGKDPAQVSQGFRDATHAHLKAYACLVLEELAAESCHPEEVLTDDVLRAFKKLLHNLKPATELALEAAKKAAAARVSGPATSDSDEADGDTMAPGSGAGGRSQAAAVTRGGSDRRDDVPADLLDSSDEDEDGADEDEDDGGESDGDDGAASGGVVANAAQKAVASAGLASDDDATGTAPRQARAEGVAGSGPVAASAEDTVAGADPTAAPPAAPPALQEAGDGVPTMAAAAAVATAGRAAAGASAALAPSTGAKHVRGGKAAAGRRSRPQSSSGASAGQIQKKSKKQKTGDGSARRSAAARELRG